MVMSRLTSTPRDVLTCFIFLICFISESTSTRSFFRVRYSSHPIKTKDQFDFARPLLYPSGFSDPQYCGNLTESSNTAHGEGWSVHCLAPTVDDKPGVMQVGSRACESVVTCDIEDSRSNSYIVQAGREWSTLTYSFLDDGFKAKPVSCSTYWDPVYRLTGLTIRLSYSQTVGPYEAGAEVLSCALTAHTDTEQHGADDTIRPPRVFTQTWILSPQEVSLLSSNAWVLELVLVTILLGVILAMAYVVIGYYNEKGKHGVTIDLEGEEAIALQMHDADGL